MLNIDLLLCGRQKFSVSTNVSSGGSVSVSPQGKQYAGTLMTVTCSPNSAYQFSSISIVKQDGTTVSYTTVTSGSRFTFIMPSSNVTVNVNYSLIPTYSISLSASGGSVRANKTSGIRAGETITLTMTPNAYYKYQSLSVKTSSGSNVTLNSNNGSTATFTMPASNVSVQATFVANATHYITPGSFFQNVGFAGEILLYGSIEPDILSNSKIISLTCDGSITYFRVSLNSGDTIVNRTVQIIRLDTMAKIQGVMAYVSNNTWYGFTESIQLFTSSDVGKRISLVISVG